MADTTTAESTTTAEPTKAPEALTAVEATLKAFEAGRAPYKDAVAHAQGLDAVGALFKGLGIVLVAVGLLGGLVLFSSWGASTGILTGVLGVMVGGGLYGFGFLLAAIGQLLLALIDTAVGTKFVAAKSLGGAGAGS